MKASEYMVCVQCMTFNHANYIEDAMNGFCMQQTDFPFVCVIVDDASTDREPAVIQKYLEDHFDLEDKSVAKNEETNDYILTYARHKTNKNCFFLVLYLKYNHYRKKDKIPYYAEWLNNSKYIAICEGDDYWIQPKKLQNQVDFLEKNDDYVLVYTGFNMRYHDEIISQSNGLMPEGNVYEKLFDDLYSFICTPTTCFRRSLYYQVKDSIRLPSFKMGDLPLWLALARLYKFKYFEEKTAVYRKLDSSASHFSDFKKTLEFEKNVQEIKLHFAELDKYTYYIDLLQNRVFQYESLIALKENKYLKSFKYFVKAHGIMRYLLLTYLKNIGK